MLRFLSAGESHGPGLTVVIDGLPAGLAVTPDALRADLARRQQGHGRGGRQKVEIDTAVIRSGVRHGLTTGSPVALTIDNRDYPSWRESMQPEPLAEGASPADVALTRPRPGHADLAGAQKLLTHDVRDVLERASARHTAARVAAGSVAQALLGSQGIAVVGHVLAIGGIEARPDTADLAHLKDLTDASPVRCADPEAAGAMVALIDEVRRQGDSLGGRVEVLAGGVPPGLGHFAEWDRRLDGRLAAAIMSVPAVKAVEIGDGFASGARKGSETHDEIVYDPATRRYRRPTNRAGGIEGGMTNGERLVVRAVMKPIPTLARPLRSVDLATHAEADAGKERTDAVAVPACAVVCEAAVAWELAAAFLERFGGDTLDEVSASYRRYLAGLEGL